MMMPAALRVLALCASTHALQMTSRRRCLNGLGGAAFITALAPRGARAEAAPTPDELKKLTLGYQRMQTLLKDWQKITGGSCGNAQLSKEKAQVVATNGGAPWSQATKSGSSSVLTIESP